jgi:hypothetical protein
VVYKEFYRMKKEKLTLWAEHVWWSIQGDTTFAFLDADEQHLLKMQKVLGRGLEDPSIPISMDVQHK